MSSGTIPKIKLRGTNHPLRRRRPAGKVNKAKRNSSRKRIGAMLGKVSFSMRAASLGAGSAIAPSRAMLITTKIGPITTQKTRRVTTKRRYAWRKPGSSALTFMGNIIPQP
jgi:hypothetical protein